MFTFFPEMLDKLWSVVISQGWMKRVTGFLTKSILVTSLPSSDLPIQLFKCSVWHVMWSCVLLCFVYLCAPSFSNLLYYENYRIGCFTYLFYHKTKISFSHFQKTPNTTTSISKRRKKYIRSSSPLSFCTYFYFVRRFSLLLASLRAIDSVKKENMSICRLDCSFSKLINIYLSKHMMWFE